MSTDSLPEHGAFADINRLMFWWFLPPLSVTVNVPWHQPFHSKWNQCHETGCLLSHSRWMAPFKSTDSSQQCSDHRSSNRRRSLLLSTSLQYSKSQDYLTCFFFPCCLQPTRARMRAAASGVSLLFFHISGRSYPPHICLCLFVHLLKPILQLLLHIFHAPTLLFGEKMGQI